MASQVDVVYPLVPRHSSPELRYSLRSLTNLPHSKVWVVGDRPEYLMNVHYIETVQKSSKFSNLCTNIEAACRNDVVSDPFYLFNDDFFVTGKIESVPDLWRSSIDQDVSRYRSLARPEWVEHSTLIRDLLNAERSYELHVPIRVHKAEMLEALKLAGYGPCWRTAYGAVARLEGDQIPDVKIYDLSARIPDDAVFVSSYDRSFSIGKVGSMIRRRFPIVSPYE